MEDNTTTNDRVSVGIEEDTSSVSFDGKGNTSASSTSDSMNQEFNREGEALSPADLAELEGDDADQPGKPQDGTDGEEVDTTAGDDKPDTDEPAAELPEWDPASEEVSAAYDGKYITKDEGGADVLNFEAFNEEFAKDRGEGKRDLNAGTRKFLKDRFGISDKLIDSHLAGVIAQEQQARDILHKQFAATPEEGEKTFNAMTTWAKENFTQAQKDRYNAGMRAGGEAALEQIELLKTRYLTKNPNGLGKQESTEPGKKPGIGLQRRAASPQKNATSGETSRQISVQPFANAEEHRIAQNEALRLTGKEQTEKLAEVRKRLIASDFYK